MRYTIVLLLFLAGCAHEVKLFEVDGTETAFGTLYPEFKSIDIMLRGELYMGDYAPARPTGLAGRAPVYEGGDSRNISYASALLTGDKGGVLQCEFWIDPTRAGRGVCIDRGGKSFNMVFYKRPFQL